MEILVVLLFVLAVVMLVGHGLWVVVAWFFRSISGQQEPSQSASPMRCPSCSGLFWLEKGRCRYCGYSPTGPPKNTLHSDVEATIRQLNRMFHTGLINEALRAQLLGLLHTSRPEGVGRGEGTVDLSLDEAAGYPSSRPPPMPAAEPSEIPKSPPSEAPILDDKIAKEHAAAPESPPPHEKPFEAEPAMKKLPASEVHALDREYDDPPVQEPSRPFSRVFQAFMEEKNIRWGELVSGILIVGSAIGLVISLWATLKNRIPYFPALLFMLVIAAIYGAGMYTLRRWKLKSTSRGLLIIATLLIPLNFLAAIALAEDRPATEPLYILAVTLGVLGFGAITSSIGRELLLRAWWIVPVAVLGTSVSQLIIDRQFQPGFLSVTLLAGLPIGCYLAATGGQLWMTSFWRRLTARRIWQIFLVLGLSSFALLMPLALMMRKSWESGGGEAVWRTLKNLSPSLSLAVIAALCLAMVVHRRATAVKLAPMRTAGTAISLVGAILLLVVLVLAWPDPKLLICVGLVNFLALTSAALVTRFHVLHLAAVASGALAWLIGFHLLQGNFAEYPALSLFEFVLWGRSGVALMVLSGITASVAGVLVLRGRIAVALYYLGSTAALAGLSIVVGIYAGFFSGFDPSMATPIFAFYTVALFVGCVVARRSEIAWFGSGLLLLTIYHGLVFNEHVPDWMVLVPRHPVIVAFLVHAAVSCTTALIAARGWRLADSRLHRGDSFKSMTVPMSYSALITSALVIPALLIVYQGDFSAHSGLAFWVCGVWLMIAIVHLWPALVTAMQAVATVAVCFAVTAVCQQQAWWDTSLYPKTFLDPRHLQLQMGILAVWCLLWSVLRIFGRSRVLVEKLFDTHWPPLDRVLLQFLAIGVAGLALFGCMPGVTEEFFGIKLNSPFHAPVGLLGSLDAIEFLILAVMVIVSLGVLCAHSLGSFQHLGFRPLVLTIVFFILLTLSHLGPAANRLWSWIGLGEAGPALATGISTWIVLALILVSFVVSLWEHFSASTVVALLYAATAVPLLVSSSFVSEQAAASALRWSLALFGVATAVLLCARDKFVEHLNRLGWAGFRPIEPKLTESLRTVGLLQVALPLLALTMGITVATAVGLRLGGPAEQSFFARMGTAFSYAVPLLMISVALIAYAIREKTPVFALAGSLMLTLAVSAAYVLPAWIEPTVTGASDSIEIFITLVQLGAIVLGGCAIAWQAVNAWSAPPGAPATRQVTAELPEALRSGPLCIQIALAALPVALLAAWSFCAVVDSPGQLPGAMNFLGGFPSHVALVLAAVACGWYFLKTLSHMVVHFAVAFALFLASLIAASVSGTRGNWLAYHVLEIGALVVAIAATAAACFGTYILRTKNSRQPQAADPEEVTDDVPGKHRPGHDSGGIALWFSTDSVVALSRWAMSVGSLVVLLALRGGWTDPTGPWWAMATTASVAALAVAMAVRARSQTLAYASSLLAALATIFVWSKPWNWIDFIEAKLITLSLMGLLWLVIDVWWQRRYKSPLSTRFKFSPVHHTSAVVCLGVMAVLVGLCLVDSVLAGLVGAPRSQLNNLGGWLSIGCLGALLIGSLWDRTSKYPMWFLYVFGMVVLAVVLEIWELEVREFFFGVGCAAAGYVLLTGFLWYQRLGLGQLARELKVPNIGGLVEQTWRWLPTASIALATLAVIDAFYIVLTFEEPWMRVYISAAVALMVPGIAALADDRLQERMRYLALMLAAVATVDFSWAILPIHLEAFWLHRAVWLMTALAVVTVAYGIVLVRLVSKTGDWFNIIRRAATTVGAMALVSLVWALAMELAWFRGGEGAPLSGAQIGQVAVVLVGLAAAMISIALLPGRDPMGFSEKGRMVYIYTAELVLTLLFVHIYLTIPELFSGVMRQYWPFIIMAIAFCGLGLGALARKAGLRVLSEPLESTGAFLPLLPALGFWILTSEVEYSSTLLFAGILYIVLAIGRQKIVYWAAAAIAGNGALWALLNEQGVELLTHPQFWMIPPALSALVAAQINRRRLSTEQLTMIRYLAVSVIYISSTGEIFISGIGQRLWPPMLLMLFSVMGVLAGMMLQIRAYLILGVSFLLISMVSMVWHAAQALEHIWPWWAFGILLGLAILTLFGVFEKKRAVVLKMLEELRQWDK